MLQLLRDRRGISAIEFALIAPVLFLVYVATIEISNLVTIYRRVGSVAFTAADLTAQVKQVSNSDLSDITAAATSILTPYPTSSLKIVITSVVADKNNNGKVAWSYASTGSGRATNSSYTLPQGLTEADGNSVIMAEVTYAFTPLLDLTDIFSPGALNMKQTFYSRPRKSFNVAKK